MCARCYNLFLIFSFFGPTTMWHIWPTLVMPRLSDSLRAGVFSMAHLTKMSIPFRVISFPMLSARIDASLRRLCFGSTCIAITSPDMNCRLNARSSPVSSLNAPMLKLYLIKRSKRACVSSLRNGYIGAILGMMSGVNCFILMPFGMGLLMKEICIVNEKRPLVEECYLSS